MAIDTPGFPAVEFPVEKMLPQIIHLAMIGLSEVQIREHLQIQYPLLTKGRWERLRKKNKDVNKAMLEGSSNKKNKIAQSCWALLEAGSVPVTIFMAKVHLGWKEGARVEVYQNETTHKIEFVNTKLPTDPIEASKEYQRIMMGDKK